MRIDDVPPPLQGLGELRSRWRSFTRRFGAGVDADAIWDGLHTHYSEAWRHYHNWGHIQACLAQLDIWPVSPANPDEVEAAIWFHDAIYRIGASDNEVRSAELSQQRLKKLNWPEAARQCVSDLIVATDHKNSPATPDAAMLCDIDLSILAAPPNAYDLYANAILREVGLPELEFGRHRRAFLSGMLAKPFIFHFVQTRNLLESRARANLSREIDLWNDRLRGA